MVAPPAGLGRPGRSGAGIPTRPPGTEEASLCHFCISLPVRSPSGASALTLCLQRLRSGRCPAPPGLLLARSFHWPYLVTLLPPWCLERPVTSFQDSPSSRGSELGAGAPCSSRLWLDWAMAGSVCPEEFSVPLG